MIHRGFAIGALAALVAGPGLAAEGGLIRSGEHAGFSRIVMTVEPTTEWSLETGERRATISFPGKVLRFDTTGIFDRMPRTRVLAVESSHGAAGTMVALQLGCDCRVTTSFVGARYLALDVHDRDSAPRQDEGAEQPAPPTEPAANAEDPAPATPTEAAEATRGTGGSAEAVTDAERILIEQIERAASQGLIELSDAPPAAVPHEHVPEAVVSEPAPAPLPRPHAVPAEGEGEPAETIADLLGHEQIEATTVYDRDGRRNAARKVDEPAPEGCLEDAAFDVASWTNGQSLHAQIPQLQRLLVGEVDRPNPEIVRDTARLYVRYGFGAEAEQVLESFDVDFPDRALLGDLARAVEQRPLKPAGPLSLADACPGRHGLWQAIAGAPQPERAPEALATLQAAFEDMPPDLRMLVGPPLIDRFLAGGQADVAALFFETVERSGEDPSMDLRLSEARLKAAEGHTEEAEAILAGVVAGNKYNSVDALTELVQNRLDLEWEIPEAWLTDLAAAAVGSRGGPQEAALRRLRAEALAQNGALDAAMAELQELHADIPAAAGEAEAAAVRLLARAEPDQIGGAAYAEVALQNGEVISPAPADDAARLTVADNLLGLGLPNAALDLLAPAVDREVEPALVMAARAHLSLGAPGPALTLLEDLPSPEVAELRARAHAERGDYAGAVDAMLEGGAPEGAVPYAWASGDWDLAVEGNPDPEQTAMAAYMSSRGGEAGAAPPEAANPLTPAAAFQQPLPSLEAPSLSAARILLATGREVGTFVQGLMAER